MSITLNFGKSPPLTVSSLLEFEDLVLIGGVDACAQLMNATFPLWETPWSCLCHLYLYYLCKKYACFCSCCNKDPSKVLDSHFSGDLYADIGNI